eukprot:gnl/Chilomastix_caulleri/1078.p1 GENE.gnl/Chilomastix_caulleri/1078~~gnl/Chilomastix_caulleri/1078.p1  ORF type:complete len:114 (+),score=23.51 gnl/Chilomastix_caulleri/1078:101-442(+)
MSEPIVYPPVTLIDPPHEESRQPAPIPSQSMGQSVPLPTEQRAQTNPFVDTNGKTNQPNQTVQQPSAVRTDEGTISEIAEDIRKQFGDLGDSIRTELNDFVESIGSKRKDANI